MSPSPQWEAGHGRHMLLASSSSPWAKPCARQDKPPSLSLADDHLSGLRPQRVSEQSDKISDVCLCTNSTVA